MIDRSIAPRRTDPCNEKKAGLSFIAVRLAPCARKLDIEDAESKVKSEFRRGICLEFYYALSLHRHVPGG